MRITTSKEEELRLLNNNSKFKKKIITIIMKMKVMATLTAIIKIVSVLLRKATGVTQQ